MLNLFLFLCSVIFEVSALLSLIYTWGFFYIFFGFHFIGSLLFSIFCCRIIPDSYKKDVKKSVLLFLILSFELSILGYLVAFIFTLVLMRQQKKALAPIDSFSLSMMLREDVRFKGRKFGEGMLSQVSKVAGQIKRQDVVMIGKDIKHPAVFELLRSSLYNPVDEIRLYAFSLISKLEEEIDNNILTVQERLKEEKDEKKRAQLYSELARLYWEMVYMNIIDKELQPIHLKEATEYIEEALKVLDDPNVYLLAGKIYLRRKMLKKAIYFLDKAWKKGLPSPRIIPYICEAYYELGHYDEIRRIFSKWDGLTFYPSLYFIYLFWTARLNEGKN